MRFAPPLLAAFGLAFLPACGSGFGGSSASQNPSVVVLSTTSGQANDFAVAPGGTSPLGVAAIAYTGSGALDEIVPGVTYTWAARYVNPLTDPPSVATYTAGPDPNGFKTCPPVPTITPPVPPSRVDMRRTASREHRIVPLTLTAKTFAMATLVTSSTRAKPPVIAALLTSALIGPKSRSAFSNMRTISCSRETSA